MSSSLSLDVSVPNTQVSKVLTCMPCDTMVIGEAFTLNLKLTITLITLNLKLTITLIT